MQTAETKRFPVDYDTLAKGDIIPVQRIEEITSSSRSSANFSFEAMKLKERIEREMEAIGKPVILKLDQGNLVVLTDSEAITYVDEMFQQFRRRMIRQHIRGEAAIDVAKLTDEEQKTHERASYVRGKEIQAITTARRQCRLEGHQRATPGLPDQSKLTAG